MKNNKINKSLNILDAAINEILILLQNNNFIKAEKLAEKLTELHALNPISWNTYGACLRKTKKNIESLEALKKAYALSNYNPDIIYNIGVAYDDLHQFNEAIEFYKKAIELNENHYEAYNNLGVCYKNIQEIDKSIEAFKKALLIKKDYSAAYNNLAVSLKEVGKFKDALLYLRKAIDIDSLNAQAYNNIGNILQQCSDIQGSIDNYIKSININPTVEEFFNNLLFTLNYHPDMSQEDIFDFYKEYDRRFISPLIQFQKPFQNNRDINRKLRIGYVSPDFKSHSASYFLEPLLANHDKSKFEIFAYAQLLQEDDITQKYKQYIDSWIITTNMGDQELVDKIILDEIDILVDLAGHTAGNRLKIFGYKPAPVSVSWLGYGYTTGVSTIDYFLTDKITTPYGCEKNFSEKIWRLENPSLVYRAPIEKVGILNELPALKNGYITFGTLTRAIRINQYTIQAWSYLLTMVPNSKLIINSRDFADKHSYENLIEDFNKFNIDASRLEIGYTKSPWDVMRKIDIGLDCFPHNSGTTLFEMLYMGIPYITLAFRPSVGRIGSSIVTGLGVEEWIAYTLDEYVEKLILLSKDIQNLSLIRQSLRTEIQKSLLMDEKGFVKKVENAYIEMFAKWINKEEHL